MDKHKMIAYGGGVLLIAGAVWYYGAAALIAVVVTHVLAFAAGTYAGLRHGDSLKKRIG